MKPRNTLNITEIHTESLFPCRSVPSVVKHFSFENVSFDYHLIREDRKTVAASVLPSQAVVLKVPHELCHMTHSTHTRAFYALLASKLPHWQRLKAELELSLLG